MMVIVCLDMERGSFIYASCDTFRKHFLGVDPVPPKFVVLTSELLTRLIYIWLINIIFERSDNLCVANISPKNKKNQDSVENNPKVICSKSETNWLCNFIPKFYKDLVSSVQFHYYLCFRELYKIVLKYVIRVLQVN